MRKPRDYRPGQLYAVTHRGNHSQWMYRDDDDFAKCLSLMRRYSQMHDVAIHGYCLLHNHGHWILEASTPESISNFMRDLQGRYSHYLNVKYHERPWLLWAPLDGSADPGSFSPYLRKGPTNWGARYEATHLTARGFKAFLRYVELNSVEAGLADRARDWPWSSAPAHCDGTHPHQLLDFDRWQHLFGRPATIAVDWYRYLDESTDHERAMRDWARRWAIAASPGSRSGPSPVSAPVQKYPKRRLKIPQP